MGTPITLRFSVGVPSAKSGFSPEHERRSGLKPLKTVFANPALKRGVIIDPVHDQSSFDSFCVKMGTPIPPRFSVGVIPSAKSGFSPEHERRSGLKPLKTVFANPALKRGVIIDPVYDLSSFDSFCVKISTPITPRLSVGGYHQQNPALALNANEGQG